ncbi:hypothetical protein BAUCODRAFT_347726 [Baudoinia panamericana UAMH 10762]|uniref:Uncharacterized protein n=1 Tax=Baudoinia panamericana (strain UAMH 10762) TaxID=717646 RepID=M2MS88_BAUPA|nr:uncharacterized protein BAUCODRAFT_347726 [Baudoinia panamericana UAMH 10762]EMC99721.1 hypothetical protein BAUCODRAFT_347726 [Baudoinia panamericana UAMH 10762]
MPSPPLRCKAQTLKQARASFKSRDRPSISDREQKQLDRAIQLDRRAWGVKEREKRRAEAVKQRQEKERREKLERSKVKQAESGDRRCDRFGFMGSQVCLGAFFGQGEAKVELGGGVGSGKATDSHDKENVKSTDSKQDDDYGEDIVDDEALLRVLNAATVEQHPKQSPTVQSASANKPGRSTISDDLADFLDELGSSTQISRELDDGQPCRMFEVERSVEKAGRDRVLMPPPPLPLKPALMPAVLKKQDASSEVLEILPPVAPLGAATEFTVAELECFVADDLQLTQAEPV